MATIATAIKAPTKATQTMSTTKQSKLTHPQAKLPSKSMKATTGKPPKKAHYSKSKKTTKKAVK
jgi:hypothetical protein